MHQVTSVGAVHGVFGGWGGGLDVLGIDRVYALADRTDANPAADPALSAQLLRDLGRTIDLPAHPQLPH